MSYLRIIRCLLSAAVALLVILFAIKHASSQVVSKDMKSLPDNVAAMLKKENLILSAPIYLRAFKEEGVIELWKQSESGEFKLVKSYDICKWSGKLGPKYKEGDYQTPEGFYNITPAQMHPKSNYHLAFNIGFPNAYDRANGRKGSFLMVHGACKSVGCYAMTDQGIEEIYAFMREAFMGGQSAVSFHAFPFRMNATNMARYAMDENMPFWTKLKIAYDVFEITHQPPRVEICGKDYVVAAAEDKSTKQALCNRGDEGLVAGLDSQYQRQYIAQYILESAKVDITDTLPTMRKPSQTPLNYLMP